MNAHQNVESKLWFKLRSKAVRNVFNVYNWIENFGCITVQQIVYVTRNDNRFKCLKSTENTLYVSEKHSQKLYKPRYVETRDVSVGMTKCRLNQLSRWYRPTNFFGKCVIPMRESSAQRTSQEPLWELSNIVDLTQNKWLIPSEYMQQACRGLAVFLCSKKPLVLGGSPPYQRLWQVNLLFYKHRITETKETVFFINCMLIRF